MNPTRLEEVPFAKIDLTDTRLKFRRNFKDEEIKKKAESISKAGLLNPVKLWKQGDRHIVIAGWQRIAAVTSLGRDSIAADVYEGITFEDAVRISIADNHLREDLSDYETACQMRAPSQYENYPAEKIAELFGCNVDRVYDLLSIFNMDAELREVVEQGDLTLYKRWSSTGSPLRNVPKY
jgi:ParB family chromosome partitioning protein